MIQITRALCNEFESNRMKYNPLQHHRNSVFLPRPVIRERAGVRAPGFFKLFPKDEIALTLTLARITGRGNKGNFHDKIFDQIYLPLSTGQL